LNFIIYNYFRHIFLNDGFVLKMPFIVLCPLLGTIGGLPTWRPAYDREPGHPQWVQPNERDLPPEFRIPFNGKPNAVVVSDDLAKVWEVCDRLNADILKDLS
jgi:hypothetical protein